MGILDKIKKKIKVMVGYPYQYNDFLSEEEAMKRRVEVFDKGVVLFVFLGVWSLLPATGFASDLPDTCPSPGSAGGGPAAPVFAPILGVCQCTSPQVKSAILIIGISSICYSALCSKDKTLIVACSSLATYAATNLNK